MLEGPGPVVLFGSGETSASGRRVHEWLFSRMRAPVRISVLETPAGFQPNSGIVAGRVGDFYEKRLQNHSPQVTVIPARKRGTALSPDDPAIVRPLLNSDAIFLGPGSPTYAVKQLRGSLAWEYIVARHYLGSATILASAATVAASSQALPVYEIYKVGEDLHWCRGLDLFGLYGLSLAFIPHWDNTEGGQDLDTSRCFMGQSRFGTLLELLPAGMTVVGIDEHTALVVDVRLGTCRVLGQGYVTVLSGQLELRFQSGQEFSTDLLGSLRRVQPGLGLTDDAWHEALAAHWLQETPDEPPDVVMAIAQEREAARARRDWPTADLMRSQIEAMGWQVVDTPAGPRVARLRAGS